MTQTHPNSFSARDTLRVPSTSSGQAREYTYFRLAALGDALRPRDAAVLAEDPAREPRAVRGRPVGDQGRHRRARVVAARRAVVQRDRVPARARAAAGLHRRPVRRRPRRDARRDRGVRRRSQAHQPAAARRARHRPLGAGRRVGVARCVREERAPRVRRATASATRSSNGASRRSTVSAPCRPTPGSCIRSTSSISRA